MIGGFSNSYLTPFAGVNLLDGGSPYSLSNKALQNRRINENILRKAAQLVSDLEHARSTPTTLGNLQSPKNSSGLTPVAYHEAQLQSSIDAILSLRQRLGIETPAFSLGRQEVLEKLLGDTNGQLFDKKL